MQVPKAWRADLEESGVILGRSEVHHVVTAKDGTVKMLLKLHDNRVVETVGHTSSPLVAKAKADFSMLLARVESIAGVATDGSSPEYGKHRS